MREGCLRLVRGCKTVLRRAAIIGVLVAVLPLLLAGCSALRVAYNTGPQLGWWYIDGYFDFSREQSPLVKGAIERWFDWHRQTQLSAYAALLVTMQAQITEPTTPAAACEWNARINDLLTPAIVRALEHSADLLPRLTEVQLKHLEGRYAKNIDEMREQFLQADLAERQAESLKRAVSRTEQIYGRLEEAQRKVIAEGVAASPFDPQAWMEERKRRQRDTLATLRRLLAERADREQRLVALKALADRSQRSPDAAYRAYQQQLVSYNCAFAARIHNATTLAQRQRAKSNLKGWEEDLRAVITPPAGPPGGDPALLN